MLSVIAGAEDFATERGLLLWTATHDGTLPERYLRVLHGGAVDAAIISVGYPAAAVLEATTTGGARLISMEAERVEALREQFPYYSACRIPVCA